MNRHQSPNPASFVIACGGTGGHVFPGLAVGHRLKTRGHVVTFCLAGRAVESSAIPDDAGECLNLNVRPVSWRHPVTAWRGLSGLAGAVGHLYRRWRHTRPDAVLAMGSYASLAPVLAARLLHIPVILHEANAVPGRAISLLSRLAYCTCLSFDHAADDLPGRRTRLTGLPIRADLNEQPPFDTFNAQGFRLLFMGGSQGARALNTRCVETVEQLVKNGMSDLAVIHLTGRQDAAWVRDRYRQAGLRQVIVEPFMREIGRAYASADLAVCRSGAASCAELCLFGLPAILIPLPSAVRDHQTANAHVLASRGAAVCLAQRVLTADALATCIRSLRQKPERLDAMRRAAQSLAHPEADRHLASLLEQVSRLDKSGRCLT